MKSVTKASQTAKELMPFILHQLRDVLAQSKGEQGAADPYAIILYDESGRKKRSYAFSAEGLQAALAAASSGDVVWLPAGTITGNFTVGAGVTLFGIDRDRVVLVGQVILGDGATLAEVTVINTGTTGNCFAIVGPSAGQSATLHRVRGSAMVSDGRAVGLAVGDGTIDAILCDFAGTATGSGTGHGVAMATVTATGTFNSWEIPGATASSGGDGIATNITVPITVQGDETNYAYAKGDNDMYITYDLKGVFEVSNFEHYWLQTGWNGFQISEDGVNWEWIDASGANNWPWRQRDYDFSPAKQIRFVRYWARDFIMIGDEVKIAWFKLTGTGTTTGAGTANLLYCQLEGTTDDFEAGSGTINVYACVSATSEQGITNRPLDMGGEQINNLADPTEAQDAATKAYVDSTADGHEHVYQEDHSDECDGAKTEFATSYPFVAASTQVWLNGLLQRPGSSHDYQEAADLRAVVFGAAPLTGDSLLLAYLKNANPPLPTAPTEGPYLDDWGALATRLVVNLHGHTTESDGSLTPAQFAATYEGEGHDGLVISDHNLVTADPGSHGLIRLPANEVTKTSGHILSINCTYTTAETDRQTIINGILAAGGLAFLAHPKWTTGFSQAEMAALTDYHGLEIFNMHVETGASSNGVSNPGFDLVDWDYLLTNVRRNIWGIATDDYHDSSSWKRYNVGRLHVFANGATASDLAASLAAGNFAADVSNYGVTPGKPTVTESGISLTAAGATKIRWIGDGGALLKEDSGESGSYIFTGTETYVRAEAVGDYYEDFADALDDQWSVVDGTWTVGDGVLTLSNKATRRIMLRRYRAGDFEAQLDVQLNDLDAEHAELVFNAVDSSRYYVARLGSPHESATAWRGLAVGYTTSNNFGSPLSRVAFTAAADTWYTLKVAYSAATGRIRAKVWETGQAEPDWMIDVSDTTWTHGGFGLRGYNCAFDNLYINGFTTYYQPIPVGDWS